MRDMTGKGGSVSDDALGAHVGAGDAEGKGVYFLAATASARRAC